MIIQTYNTFVQRIEELGLPKDVDAKPMLDVTLSCDILKVVLTSP